MTRRYNSIPRNIRTYNQNPTREQLGIGTSETQREQEAHAERIEAGRRMMQEQLDDMTTDEANDFWNAWCS